MINKAFKMSAILALCISAMNAQDETPCELAAFVRNPLSAVNIRSGPGLDHKILETIPQDKDGTIVFIVGARDDWLKISRAVNSRKTRVFSGSGWVHAPLLSVKTRGEDDELVMYYKNPRTETEPIGGIRADLNVNVLSCSGDWMKVLIPRRGTEGIPGWLPSDSFCGSPWDECDPETAPNALTEPNWKETEITYKDNKDRGILKAEYNLEPQQGKDCVLTIRLINTTEKPIAHYWFKFLFADGHMHENSMTDHSPGEPFEMTYGSCAIKSIEISEVGR